MANYKVVDADQLDADLTAVADAIRSKTGSADTMTLDQMPAKISGIEGSGGGLEPFWLPYITNVNGLFKEAVFPENTEIVLEIPNLGGSSTLTYGGSLYEVFQGTQNVISAKIIAPERDDATTIADGMFRYNSHIRKVDLSEFKRTFANLYMSFYNCFALEEIIGEVSVADANNQFSNAFANCYVLKEVRFKTGTIYKNVSFVSSDKLSDTSIQSILDGLANLTGGTAQTLTLHATVGAKLTDEQKAAVAAKNWTLAY